MPLFYSPVQDLTGRVFVAVAATIYIAVPLETDNHLTCASLSLGNPVHLFGKHMECLQVK
jgi:hypothetical protein